MSSDLLWIHNELLAAYGPQGWWPGETPFEVVVGAILTQRVSWTNVEKGIASLKAAGLMDARGLAAAPSERIAALIRPCLYYNAKARKLQAFVETLFERHAGSLEALFAQPTAGLREELLSIYGIGEETADAILLYAAGRPSFVIDAYTRRILSRLGLAPSSASYRTLQALFTEGLPRDVVLYQEYHALLVQHGKTRCRSRRPLCGDCPLRRRCTFAPVA
jgi:endonuclease III related protein